MNVDYFVTNDIGLRDICSKEGIKTISIDDLV